MKKKIYLLAFMLCILSCGLILTACNGTPTLEFVEGASLTREYNGQAITQEDVLNIIEVSEGEEVTISFTQNDNEIDAPKNVGSYTAIISIPSKTIEHDFEITTKSIEFNHEFEYNGTTQFSYNLDDVTIDVTFSDKNVGATFVSAQLSGEASSNYTLTTATASIVPKVITNVVFPTTSYVNLTTERRFTKELDTTNGIISGDSISLVVVRANSDYDAAYKSIELTGTNSTNYTVSQENITMPRSFKITITTADGSTTVNFHVKYGDNKLYTLGLCTQAITPDNLSSLGSNVKIYKSFDSTISEIIDISTATLKPNARYSETGYLTDSNGNWIMPTGSNADALSFTAGVVI